jgi:thiol-disulfide isomerase/thioredoxin
MPSDRRRPDSGRSGAAAGPASAGRRTWLLGAAGWCAAASWPQRALASRLAVGKPAPPLALHTLDGQTLSTESLRGKVVILAFWATWCAPCREELPLLSSYAKAHADQGLQVLGFSLDAADNLAMVRQVAAGLSFPVGLLGSEWAGDYGRIWKLPVSFTIDRSGVLVDISWDDAQPGWTEARLQRVVTPLL